MRKLANNAMALIAFALVMASLPVSVSAQKQRPMPPGPQPPSSESEPRTTTRPREMRSPEQAFLEMNILLSRRYAEADRARERRRIAAQLTRDFERLDQINTEKLLPLSLAKVADYEQIARTASEVKDCASRIRYNTPLSLKDKTGDKTRVDAGSSELGRLLPELSRAIRRFLGNPVLYVNAPNDDQLRSAAGHDLESIIRLGDTINKIARRLGKTMASAK